jgi:hypothetical protein
MTLNDRQIEKELLDFFKSQENSVSKKKLLPYSEKLKIENRELNLKFSPKIEKEKQIKVRTFDFKKKQNSKKSLF